MRCRVSTHGLIRFQDTFSDRVLSTSSADGAERADFVLVIFLVSQWCVHQNKLEDFLYSYV